ncbi:MAG TPA: MltA domain-containing protein [Methylomirabilota bacterium]|jgi:membrane-bound lytic murein transglycosylase A
MSAPASFARSALARALAPGLMIAALGAGCAAWRAPAAVEPATALRPAPRAPVLRDDADPASLRAAVTESLAWLAAQSADRVFVAGPRRVTVAEQARALRALLGVLSESPGPERLAAYVRETFELLESAGGPEGRVLVTGYYEPVVDAAERPSPEYGVPVLALPDDLVEVRLEAFDPRYRGERLFGRVEGRRLVPYWPRADIDAGRLAGRGLELAWARDPVDVFFMEIQGSGTLRFPDGREQRVGYAGANGRAYRAIGRLLIDEGQVPGEKMSMQAIRDWLEAHPDQRQRVLQHNESYVFFRPLPGPPEGSLGRPLTPGRSVATDARLFPPGALAFLETEWPEQAPDGTARWAPLTRFVLNQDTGGAIRGAGRVDFFWGRGEAAAFAAGLMRQPGRLYFLVPRRQP